MSSLCFANRLKYKELKLRVLPPIEQAKQIQATSLKDVKYYGRHYVPYGLIHLFRGRIAEIDTRGLSNYERGRLCLVENNLDQAEFYFERALQEGDERACGNWGRIKEMRGDIEKALGAYKRGKDSTCKNSLGNYYENLF